MNEKLKNNFLYNIALHYFKFYNCFYSVALKIVTFLQYRVFNWETKSHFVSGGKIKKGINKVAFTKLPFRIATVFTAKI